MHPVVLIILFFLFGMFNYLYCYYAIVSAGKHIINRNPMDIWEMLIIFLYSTLSPNNAYKLYFYYIAMYFLSFVLVSIKSYTQQFLYILFFIFLWKLIQYPINTKHLFFEVVFSQLIYCFILYRENAK